MWPIRMVAGLATAKGARIWALGPLPSFSLPFSDGYCILRGAMEEATQGSGRQEEEDMEEDQEEVVVVVGDQAGALETIRRLLIRGPSLISRSKDGGLGFGAGLLAEQRQATWLEAAIIGATTDTTDMLHGDGVLDPRAHGPFPLVPARTLARIRLGMRVQASVPRAADKECHEIQSS